MKVSMITFACRNVCVYFKQKNLFMHCLSHGLRHQNVRHACLQLLFGYQEWGCLHLRCLYENTFRMFDAICDKKSEQMRYHIKGNTNM